MKPYFSDGQVALYLGDCRDVLPLQGVLFGPTPEVTGA